MTDEQMALHQNERAESTLAFEVLNEQKSFAPPVVIDEELAQLLILKGQQVGSRRGQLFALTFLGTFCGSFVTRLFQPSFPFIVLLLTAVLITLLVGIGVAVVKTRNLSRAFGERRFDTVTRLMPSAMLWSARLSPFTYFQRLECLRVQYNLLMLEGRHAEWETLIRFVWGMSEKREQIGAAPRNWALAVNLGTAYQLQHKYEDAAKIFYENLPRAKRKADQLIVINNLVYCLLKSNKLDEAEKYLYEALELNGKNLQNLAGMRLQLLGGLLQTEKNEFDAAEISIHHASDLSLKLRQPDDFRAYCNAAMAEIRRRQKRFDEAELYFRNAVDIFAAADNPMYLDLALVLRDYADTLDQQGKLDEAVKQSRYAKSCYDFYVQRETDTVNLIKNKLESKERIRYPRQLLDLGSRVKSIEILDTE